ncbi:hypothetical protein QA601_13135 [Chitinispirillales bacterium ANBcel5]|uniref:hypothetical protein n=1 Tax=Cellulosispirillum alkaliphilum TaxID=3039283 RepID=UPI002A51C299|nr:hypothetical protein [Chitinispirillales bacterium ANBcel5]
MEAAEVEAKLIEELKVNSVYKDDIKQYLVTPEKAPLIDIEGNETAMWIVFRKNEYVLVYDESNNEFGVGYRTIVDELVFSGFSGTVYDAYERLVRRNSD